MNQTLDQQRAAAAWKHISEELHPGYAQLVRGTSVHILTNGLGQTLAFYLAKAKNDEDAAHYQVMQHVAQWVLHSGKEADTDKTPGDLLTEITTEDSDRYRTHTTEALAYLDWLKRFAEATASEPESSENHGE